MRRPWPSPFGRARHAHRYHRRTKRKYRAVAINGFTPEHLHVGRPAGRPRDEDVDAAGGRGTGRVRGRKGETERKDAPFLPPRRDRQDGGARCTDLPTYPRGLSKPASFDTLPFLPPRGLPLRVPDRSRRCGLQDSDPRFGFRSNGRAGSRELGKSHGMLECMFAMYLSVFPDT